MHYPPGSKDGKEFQLMPPDKWEPLGNSPMGKTPTPGKNSSEPLGKILVTPRKNSFHHIGEGTDEGTPLRKRQGRPAPPTVEEVKLQSAKIGLPDIEAEKFFSYYSSKGWTVGRSPMRSWVQALTGWKLRAQSQTPVW